MFKLGITGGMGSGKSTAARFFVEKGAVVFDADIEAKNHLLSQMNLQKHIIDTFGEPVMKENRLDLLKLSEHVFSNKQYQETLNKIIWPEIYSLIKSSANKASLDNADLFVVDAALLLEAGYTEYFDSILLITAKKSLRLQRIWLRKNIPDDQMEKRMAFQMNESKKKQLVQTTIENNGDVNNLHIKLEAFYRKLNLNKLYL